MMVAMVQNKLIANLPSHLTVAAIYKYFHKFLNPCYGCPLRNLQRNSSPPSATPCAIRSPLCSPPSCAVRRKTVWPQPILHCPRLHTLSSLHVAGKWLCPTPSPLVYLAGSSYAPSPSAAHDHSPHIIAALLPLLPAPPQLIRFAPASPQQLSIHNPPTPALPPQRPRRLSCDWTRHAAIGCTAARQQQRVRLYGEFR
jgi:hypothetical protein